MCGIAGIVDFGSGSASRWDGGARARQVTRMREALHHRGPDDWALASLEHASARRQDANGIVTHPRAERATAGVWLGHQRLAIIDPSDAGAQPMRSEQGAWFAFNGAIYNFRDLQHQFDVARDSHSDTAVLLEAIETRGMDVLPHLRGMFAFAYWDDREGALYLARDRFGIKPLYWTTPSTGVIAFASEARALRAVDLAGAYRPDVDAAFLRSGHVPPATSAFEGLQVLPPGCWLRFDGSGAVVTRWFETTSVFGAGRQQSAADAGRALEAALDDTVRAHMVSDVPVGVFLSGGLDSAALVASASRIGGTRLRTFTVTVAGSSIDESIPAARIAHAFGTDHTEVAVPREELARWIEDALEAMGEPTIDGVNTFIVSRAASRAGLKVALSGLGSDEVLGGYPSFRQVPQLWRALAPFRAGVPGRGLAAGLARLAPVAAPRKLAGIVREPARTRAGLWRQYRALFDRRTASAISGASAPPDDLGADAPALPMLDVIMQCEIEEFMSAQLLRDSDAFSMCGSLELRVPFVDHVFMQRVHERGWWPRGSHHSTKAAIFDAMPHALPASHIRRPKTGFVIPMGDWMRAALGGDPALAPLRGRLSHPSLRPAVEAFGNGTLDAARLWALVVRRHFLDEVSRG